MRDTFPQNLLSAREEKALGTMRGSALLEEAVRPSRKWVFTLLVEGPWRSLEGHNRQEQLNSKQVPHDLLVHACFPVLGSNPRLDRQTLPMSYIPSHMQLFS